MESQILATAKYATDQDDGTKVVPNIQKQEKFVKGGKFQKM